MLKVRPSMEPY